MTSLKQRSVNGKTIAKHNDQKKTQYSNPLTNKLRKWTDGYAEYLDEFFLTVPDYISTFIATLAIFTFGATMRGEWVVILVTAFKQLSGHTQTNVNGSAGVLELFTAKNMKMEGFWSIFIGCHVASYAFYFIVGGFLHWHFYVKKRHLAKEWKIQPDKWLSFEQELNEIMWGVLSLFCAASMSAFLACYIMNGNPSTVYFQFDEYGWWWLFLQIPVNYIYNDYTTYILHRYHHTSFMYKYFHKVHHQYKQPTAFSVTAVHPVEIIHTQLTMCLPLFLFPIHWLPFYCNAIYVYYHGITSHSGINFKAQWWQPWQPDTKFHDDHHVYFHCNFGFNMFYWDKLHGTMMQKDRVYTEETYHGEAPLIGSSEADAILASDPERADVYKEHTKKS